MEKGFGQPFSFLLFSRNRVGIFLKGNLLMKACLFQ